MTPLYIGSDNSVILDLLTDSFTGQYINSGVTMTFTTYRIIAADAIMTSGSAALSSATASFVAGDVGRAVIVVGAGVDGADLRTTISAYTSATQVTLGTAASQTVSRATLAKSLSDAKDVAMSYVASSNGKYRGILDEGVALADGQYYVLEVTIDAGSDRKDFRRLVLGAKYRT